MKKTIVSLAVTAIITGILITSCESSADKVKNAQDNLQDAKEKVIENQTVLNKAEQDTTSEYQKFRKEAEEKIAIHEKSIAEFKARIASDKKENQEKYEKRLAELEQQNSDMKKTLEDYKESGINKWDDFKTKFNHDMENLGNAFKAFTNKNI
jgi:uncharacterized protein